MVDVRISRILELSNTPGGITPPIRDIEREFAGLSKSCFSTSPPQPKDLAKYGFGVQNGIEAVVPFCIHRHIVNLDLSKYASLKNIIEKIEKYNPCVPYPIIAGSAVFLGVEHKKCDDIDLATYVLVGGKEEERVTAGDDFRQLIENINPVKVKLKLLGGKEVSGQGKDISDLIDNFIGRPASSESMSNIDYAMLKFNNVRIGKIEKDVTLKVHFIHMGFSRGDIYPYQELHKCCPDVFFHVGRPWLLTSLRGYLEFLFKAIQPPAVMKSTLKAAKRAAMLAGVMGDWSEQDDIISYIRRGAAPMPSGSGGLKSKINALRARASSLLI